MLALDGNNELAIVGSILNKKTLNTSQIQNRKFMYLEGLIRFLELYAQNEIGDVEVDIEKISLWINSPHFENVDVYKITSIESVYKMLTNDLFNNKPLYRFLKLDDYKLKILERDHYNELVESFKTDYEKYPCLKCIWYEVNETQFGRLSKCHLPKDKLTNTFSTTRKGYHKIDSKESINCKYCATVDNIDAYIEKHLTNNKNLANYDKCNINSYIAKYTKDWLEKLEHLDNSYIPVCVPESAKVYLDKEEDRWNDLSRVMGNKKTKTEMIKNLRFAMVLEAMIKFVEIYAQTELGNDYIANISNIAKYLNTTKLNFKSKEEFYEYLENQIIDGFDMTKFCTRKTY